jgi:hypothetical protein
MKMSLRKWVGGSKNPQNTLTQYKDGPLYFHKSIIYTRNHNSRDI